VVYSRVSATANHAWPSDLERNTPFMPRSNRAAAGGKSRAAVRAQNRKLKSDARPEKKGRKGDR
jgi:hypothetical protein